MTERTDALQKKIHIKTYGCQMNAYDSSRMEELMAPMGYSLTDTVDDADMVVLNTCHIREKAAEKMYSDLGRIRPLKADKEQAGSRMVVAVAGCVAQAEGEEIRRRAPYVDIVVGPQTYQKLPDLVARSLRDHTPSVELEFGVDEKFDTLSAGNVSRETKSAREKSVRETQAFLTIQEGCDKFCTFCVVPYTRGAEFSRTVSQIEGEARKQIARGALEITLLGQNVNAYHGQGPDGKEWNLSDLIRHLAKLEGLERIRYMTSHPRDMDDALIAAHGEVDTLMPFMHLPVQSGSDAILKKMNRKHTAAFYIDIIKKMRAARPDIAFSSDFIVGFPGETEADFEATLALVREVKYAQCYSFKYSKRPGTPAAESDAQVPEDVKNERLSRLNALLAEQQRDYNASFVGTVMPVMVERKSRQAGQMTARSPYMHVVHIDQCDLPVGAMAHVMITESLVQGLRGSLAANGAENTLTPALRVGAS